VAPLSRRLALQTLAGTTLLGGLGTGVARAEFPDVRPGHGSYRDPFTLGVASGDPWATGVVLWTRLAPEPLAADGRGGMPRRTVTVHWEVAEDERFTVGVRGGYAAADPAWAHSVHLEVDGLRPGATYWYRFRAGGYLSPTGRTRTAPPAGAMPEAARFGIVSCANWEEGFFTAYGRLAEEEPDLVLHLGDYLYELPAGAGLHRVRRHVGGEADDLASYRRRYAQYKTDPDLQALHAAAPWAVVFDDHEVDDNWAGWTPRDRERDFAGRRADAFRAYYEHLPLRRRSIPRGPRIQAYRRLPWGDLATVHLMDTRQYRYDQVCGDTRAIGCSARLTADRTMLGRTQERWLSQGLRESRGRWDLLAQQVFMAQKDSWPGPVEQLAMDAWDGYPRARGRLLSHLAGVRNPVVLTGDVHKHYANDLRRDFDDPDSPVLASELVTSSVSSNGDGSARTALIARQLAENPHLRFADGRRGYVVARLAPHELRAEFRVLDRVTRRGVPARTAAVFALDDGRRRMRRVR
jgi:alkaline phosphatase D